MRTNLCPTNRLAKLFITLATLSYPSAFGQSSAIMTEDPGADITVIVDVEVGTSLFGTDSGVANDTVPVRGRAAVTLFPTDPPFTHVRFNSLVIDVDQIDLVYQLFIFFRVDATFTNLKIKSTEPFEGTISPAGNLEVPVAPMQITGDARIVSPGLSVDETIAVDATSTAAITGLLGGGEGTVLMGAVALPTVEWDVPVDVLPSAITSLNVTVVTDASRIIFRGPYAPTVLGDANANGLIDVGDWPELAPCMDNSNVSLICPVFFYDGDQDVDLVDVAEFQVDLTSP